MHQYTDDIAVKQCTYLSTLIAVKLSIDAVQHMTSQATHASHRPSPRPHSPARTCKYVTERHRYTVTAVSRPLSNGQHSQPVMSISHGFIVGRPFVKRFALCYRTVVLSVRSVCPVCDVGILWPNGLTDQDQTWPAGRPRPRPHCVRWGPSSPPPKRGGHPPNFRPMSIVAKRLDTSRCHLVPR